MVLLRPGRVLSLQSSACAALEARRRRHRHWIPLLSYAAKKTAAVSIAAAITPAVFVLMQEPPVTPLGWLARSCVHVVVELFGLRDIAQMSVNALPSGPAPPKTADVLVRQN